MKFTLTIIFLLFSLFVYRRFLDFAEVRSGIVLPDPILQIFNPIDLTWLIFAVIYLSLIIGAAVLAKNPETLLLALQTYIAIIIVRIIAMYLVPFEAPEKLIILKDPFVEMFGSGESLTKDLFFSGHTATLFLLFLVADSKRMKYIFLAGTAVVAFAVVMQHVHYIIDVFAAPFFTYACYALVKNLRLYKIT